MQILYFKGSSKLDIKLRICNYLNQIHIKMTYVLNKLIHQTNKLIKKFDLGLPLFNAYNTFNKIFWMSRFLTFHWILIIFSAYTRLELQTVKLLDSVTCLETSYDNCLSLANHNRPDIGNVSYCLLSLAS